MIFALIVCLSSAFVLQEDEQKPQIWTGSQSDLVRFNNVSGPGVLSKHVTSFIKFANDAASLYKENINANLQYIKKMMDSSFGSPDGHFFVAVQTKQTASGFYVWIQSDQLNGSLNKINKYYPRLELLVPSRLMWRNSGWTMCLSLKG